MSEPVSRVAVMGWIAGVPYPVVVFSNEDFADLPEGFILAGFVYVDSCSNPAALQCLDGELQRIAAKATP